MDKEKIKTKQGVSGGVLCLIIVLCLLLGLTSGYIVHDVISNKQETNIEAENVKPTKNTNEEKSSENIENKNIENNTPIKLGKSKGIDIKEICSDYYNCSKEFELSNEIITYKIKIEVVKKEYDLETYLTLENQKLVSNETWVNSKYNFGIIQKIGIFDNGILVIESSGSSTPTGIARSYYKDGKKITEIFDFIGGSGYISEDIVSKKVIYHTEGSCYANNTKRDEYEHLFTLNDDGTFTKEDTKTTTKGCAGQS